MGLMDSDGLPVSGKGKASEATWAVNASRSPSRVLFPLCLEGFLLFDEVGAANRVEAQSFFACNVFPHQCFTNFVAFYVKLMLISCAD